MNKLTIEKLKTAVANLNAYLEECHGEDDTVTFTTNVVRSIKENYEELIRCKLEIDILIRKKESLRDEISKLENEVENWKRTADYNAQKYAELVREMEGD